MKEGGDKKARRKEK